MIVDTSAIVAILTGEAEADDLLAALARMTGAKISAGTLLEAGTVLTNRALPQQGRRDDFLAAVGVSVVPFDEEQSHIGPTPTSAAAVATPHTSTLVTASPTHPTG